MSATFTPRGLASAPTCTHALAIPFSINEPFLETYHLPWQGRIERGDLLQHMFFRKKKDVSAMFDLLQMKTDRAYYVLSTGNGFSDIAQYVARFDNLKIITVPSAKLNIDFEYIPK